MVFFVTCLSHTSCTIFSWSSIFSWSLHLMFAFYFYFFSSFLPFSFSSLSSSSSYILFLFLCVFLVICVTCMQVSSQSRWGWALRSGKTGSWESQGSIRFICLYLEGGESMKKEIDNGQQNQEGIQRILWSALSIILKVLMYPNPKGRKAKDFLIMIQRSNKCNYLLTYQNIK